MKRTPVYILSGFLGSGKTTVLLRMIEAVKAAGKKPAIILNELGKVNVEKHLFSEDQVNELLDGCICCTIQNNFRDVLDELTVSKDIDLLIIEGTGVANPIELIEVLTEPKYTLSLSLQSVIGVVDASRFLEYTSIFFSSSDMRILFKDQIKCASYIILNKTDVLSAKKLLSVEQKLRSFLAPGVSIYKTSFGNIQIDEVLKKRIVLSQESEERVSHHAVVKAIRLEDVPILSQKRLQDWVKMLPQNIYRGKGIVRLEGKKEIYELQYASGLLRLEAMYVDDPSTSTSLVFIGDKQAVADLKQSFANTFSWQNHTGNQKEERLFM
ncbi:GTP-binding protein [Ectobacillus antri]|uniref:GTP-binding protein n=1 Tax=Ectobacillus antri TaxID=2486280 RepID=A0ABT6H6I9_9BACI|nr:GTP-binding protein [Ectobacillus antri]MDG4657406.1 GTP-binding protein [Ectobacillus antri]MDG5754463.1 GTP-binding protein [Ectobacillus antri]